jgi:hypothetical protein
MPTICPGQDTRYWRPGDIFDVTCGVCGAQVEFFKDDVTRRCRSCGTVIRNPKITLGCAQWCEHVTACLGYDPRDVEAGDAADGSLLDTILAAVRRMVLDEERVCRALAVVEEAEDLLRNVQADRRIVLAAAAVATVDSDATPGMARQVLEHGGLDSPTIEDVCDLLTGDPGSLERVEGQVLREAVRRAGLRAAARTTGSR